MSYWKEMIDVEVERYVAVVGDKAFGLSELIEGDVDLWLPKSQISLMTTPDRDVELCEVDVGDYIESARIPRWLARDKNMGELE